jgi:hypothetical protein
MTVHSDVCCEALRRQNTPCDLHGLDCPDLVVRKFKRCYGIKIPDSVGGGYYEINYCPWCGTALRP